MREKSAWLLFTIVILTLLLGAARSGIRAATPTWENVTGNLANMPSECGNLTMLSPVPGGGTVIAGVALKGLWANSSGTTWTQLGTGQGSQTITNRPSSITYDPANPASFWESGIYNGGGVYKTTNGGVTFSRLGTLTHNDYVSVDFTDPNRRTVLVGGHEQTQTVYRSTDGGVTWANAGSTLPANTKFSQNPVAITSQIHVVNTQGYNSGIAGVFRTTNGGMSWQQVSTTGPERPPLVTSNGTIYWSAFGSLLKSSDAGATWTLVGSGLQWVTPVELPDGRLATAGGTTIVVSSDGGRTWSSIGPALPYRPQGLIYSAARQAFFIWNWDCGSVVLPNAIMKLDFAVPSAQPPAPPLNLRIITSPSAN